MAAKLLPVKSSLNMKAIKSKNTAPELAVRRILTKLGYRYRLHSKELPGKPDIVFIGRKKVIYLHGCFWHVHAGCKRSSIPVIEYWKIKLKNNVQRDLRNFDLLEKLGWKYLIIWECEIILNFLFLEDKITAFLNSD